MTVATTEAKTHVDVKWWYYPLLLAVPAAGILWFLNRETGAMAGQLNLAVFVVAAVALIPLASMIGDATDAVGAHVGPIAGGLLNATFSNVPELAIGVFLLLHAHLNAGADEIVRSDHDIILGLLVGSVINNVLLVLGVSVFVAALRHGRLKFAKEDAAGYSSMLALAVVGLALPTIAASFSIPGEGNGIENVSLLVGVILVVTYVAYIAATVFKWRDAPADGAARAALEAPVARDNGGLFLAFAIFAILTALTVGIAFVLVDTTDHAIKNTPLTSLSVGLIIFPILCNVGELAGVARSALDRNMPQAMAVAGNSAVQVPLLVAPLLIFIAFLSSSGVADQMLGLTFQPLLLIVVGLVTFVYALVSLDGEVTWLEGLQLLAFYAMISVTALALPGR